MPTIKAPEPVGTCHRCGGPVDSTDAVVSQLTLDGPSIVLHGACLTAHLHHAFRVFTAPNGAANLKAALR